MFKYYTRRLTYWLLSLGLVSISSCHRDNEQLPVSPLDPNIVSLHDAEIAAQHSSNSFIVQQLIKQSKTPVIKQVIANFIAVPDQAKPAYYIFNYKDGGYIILAADRRVEPVLAYSETGSYQKSGVIPYGLTIWLTKNYENMQQLRQHKELSAPAIVTTQWAELLGNQSNPATAQPTNPTASRPLPPCQPYSNTQTGGPLLATAWGQGCFYNDFCPTGTYSCGHVPTGCVATAMAQVMYYYRFPSSFSWATMPTTTGNSSVASLMSQVGVSVGMHYSDVGSGAATQNIVGALRNTFGYGSASYGNYNYNTLRNNIDALKPVVLQAFTDHSYTGILWWETEHPDGEGHAWVCDGYQDSLWDDCAGSNGSFSMLHMNWGWNEAFSSNNYNGWYREYNWTVTRTDASFNFQYFKEMVYNIHP